MKELKNGSVTSPLGFKANGLRCGLKRKNFDLALLYSIVPAQAAGVFTKNKIKAAPVRIDQLHLRGKIAQAVVVNSGNANCCTGSRGEADALAVATRAATLLDIPVKTVLVASTGVIGKFLPVERILGHLALLVSGLGFDRQDLAARAIMTTDSFAKQCAVEIDIGGRKVTIGAVAKGAGMICPQMATMLCFITTDACIGSDSLQKALERAVDTSFNRISVDGEMSTNDTVIIMANGLALNRAIPAGGALFNRFVEALTFVSQELAKMIVVDGEGATKFLEIQINGAASAADARRAGMQIANSPLVKTMAAGENPNWGRIAACVGASRARFDPQRLEISLQGRTVYKQGSSRVRDLNDLLPLLKGEKKIQIGVHLHSGRYRDLVWTSDLTKEYVQINAEYN